VPGLGRGLDVLLGQTPARSGAAAVVSGISEIPLEKVAPNPQQPRHSFPAEGLQQLAASIRRHGVLQPIVVSRNGDGYQLVAGHRRVLASRLAERSTIPAVIREEVGDRLELALVENVQRADLTPIEEARAYRLLMETYGLTQEQLADRVGKARSSVANTLRALQAPQALLDAVQEGRISEGHLRALLPLGLSEQLALLAEIESKGLTVRDVESRARRLKKGRGRGGRRLDPDLQARVDELRATLGTKVEIRRGRRGGHITISFYSDEELARLYDLLTGVVR